MPEIVARDHEACMRLACLALGDADAPPGEDPPAPGGPRVVCGGRLIDPRAVTGRVPHDRAVQYAMLQESLFQHSYEVVVEAGIVVSVHDSGTWTHYNWADYRGNEATRCSACGVDVPLPNVKLLPWPLRVVFCGECAPRVRIKDTSPGIQDA